jgi:hypothetical protein
LRDSGERAELKECTHYHQENHGTSLTESLFHDIKSFPFNYSYPPT